MKANDNLMLFLLKTLHSQKMKPQLKQLVDMLLKEKDPKESKELFMHVGEILMAEGDQEAAEKIYSQLFDTFKFEDKQVLAKYLSVAADRNPEQAFKILQSIKAPIVPTSIVTDDEYLQQIIDEGMPEKKKEKKTKNVVEETKGGAEIFIPKKRKRKPKYPKGFDEKNPGPEPDPERWLPKWQRARFKKYARKKGVYLKGAQGDTQIDTDVTAGLGKDQSSTAH